MTPITLSWTAVKNAVYSVYRATAAEGPFVLVASALTSLGYVDVVGPGNYFWQVVAIEPNAGASAPSNTVNITLS